MRVSYKFGRVGLDLSWRRGYFAIHSSFLAAPLFLYKLGVYAYEPQHVASTYIITEVTTAL